MNAGDIISAFIASANQYASSQSETHHINLQRHLEVLLSLITEESNAELFEEKSVLTSQCITHLINLLLGGSASKPVFVSRTLTILQNLLRNERVLQNMRSTFHLCSAVSTFMQNERLTLKDPLMMQCLEVLQSVTYGLRIEFVENNMESLIDQLLKCIEDGSSGSGLVSLSLHVLSNLLRHNEKIQHHICHLPNLKHIIKHLIDILNTESPSLILLSMSILLGLSRRSKLAAKLWTSNHLSTAFDLILKALFCNDETSVRTALDLLSDVMSDPRFTCVDQRFGDLNNDNQSANVQANCKMSYSSSLLKCPKLSRALRKISKSMSTVSPLRLTSFLRFLLTISRCDEGINEVCCVFCTLSDDKSIEIIHPMLINSCVNNNSKIRIHGLNLIKHIIMRYAKIQNTNTNVEPILKVILNDLDDKSGNDSKDMLESKLIIFSMLNILCQNVNMFQTILQYINLSTWEKIALLTLQNRNTEQNSNTELFLTILGTMSAICHLLPDSKNVLQKLLCQDNAMYHLALGLKSDSKELIKLALSIISQTDGSCPLDTVIDALLSKNCSESEVNMEKGIYELPVNVLKSSPRSSLDNVDKEKSINLLLSQIESGLHIKDIKSTQVMDLYEHKIAMMVLKEQELQSYVDAKSNALQQADKMITHYKVRQANTDAETLKLRDMLKEYGSQAENLMNQLEISEHRRRELEQTIAEYKEKVIILGEKSEEERNTFKNQMSQEREKYKILEEEKLQKEEEINAKVRDIEDLRKRLDESMKASERAKMAAKEKQEQLEQKIEALTQQITEQTETLNGKLQQLSDTQTQVSKLQKDVNMLELLCKKYEGVIEEKDSKIATVTADLEKALKNHDDVLSTKNEEMNRLQEIIGMINNLSASKMSPRKKKK